MTKRTQFSGEIGALVVIMAIAAFARFYRLTTLPDGFHGDEGVVGMEAERVLHGDLLGLYSTLGGGHPTGPVYLDAVGIRLFGPTILGMRFINALVGTLTVAALYLLLRRHLGRRSALYAAGFCAVLSWHIHFSRIGFPLVVWPFFVILGTLGLMEAIRRSSDWRWWALAGLAGTIGTYMYNAHHLFLAIMLLFGVGWLGFSNTAKHLALPTRGICAAAFVVTAVIVVIPMVRCALDPNNHYFERFRNDSILQRQDWQTLEGVGPRLMYLGGRYLTFWKVACFSPQLDDKVDGAPLVDAAAVVYLIPPLMLLLAIVGIILGLRRQRHPLLLFGLVMVLAMPMAFVFTTGGLARRPIAMAPFLMMFVGVGCHEILQRISALPVRHRRLATGALVLAILVIIWQNLWGYFVVTANSPEQAWIYAAEFTDAVRFMKTLPPDDYVYFASDRWSINYETRQYLAPEVKGEDRSRQFGRADYHVDAARGVPVIILVGEYKDKLKEVQDLYPGGRTENGGEAGHPSFFAYFPPIPRSHV